MCSETIRVVLSMYTQWNEEFGHDLKLLKVSMSVESWGLAGASVSKVSMSFESRDRFCKF